MQFRWKIAVLAGAVIAELFAPVRRPGTASRLIAEEPQAENRPEPASVTALPRPVWRVGDTWDVETVTREVQGRDESAKDSSGIRWRFEVAAIERRADRDCFRIDVDCLAEGRFRPRASLWCDAESLMIREVQTRLPVGGSYRTLREAYEARSGTSSPVLTPLNALPLDLPAFSPPGASNRGKGAQTFAYTSRPGPVGAKDPAVVRFTHEIQQDVSAATGKEIEDMPGLAKDLGDRPAVTVRLKAPRREIIQLWQEGRPWPVFTSNGRTRARLIPTVRQP